MGNAGNVSSRRAARAKLKSWFNGARIAYVTDVEGHWGYFCNWVDLSDGVSFERRGDHRQSRAGPAELELRLEDGWHFVFGGDSCDKGPGALRFLEAMVRFKDKYPDRVHLLLGNRDINKMRWTAELAVVGSVDGLNVPGAFWVPAAARQSPRQFLTKRAAAEEGIEVDSVSEEQVRLRDTKANRLRFMMVSDMGADGEFEHRRQELAHLCGEDAKQISDADVVCSYEQSLMPGGWMREYLRRAQLGVLIGDALFVHGQIIGTFNKGQVKGADANGVAWCVGAVPGVSGRVHDLREWLTRLNKWCALQVEDWIRYPTWRTLPKEATYEDWAGRGGAELMAYGTPGSREPTVVYSRYLTERSMPQPYPEQLEAYLISQGVRFVVVGHTPHGNCPTIIPSGRVTMVMGDTSMSHLKADLAYKGDNRGRAASDISIVDGVCSVKGYTEQSRVLEYCVAPGDTQGCDRFIGCMKEGSSEGSSTSKNFFVKARLPAGPGTSLDSYLMSHIDGYKYETEEVPCSDFHAVLSGSILPAQPARAASGERAIEHWEPLTQDRVEELSQLLDRDGDGAVIKEELLAAASSHAAVRDSLAAAFPGKGFDAIFEVLDSDQNGRVSREELELLCRKEGPRHHMRSPHDRQASSGGAYQKWLGHYCHSCCMAFIRWREGRRTNG